MCVCVTDLLLFYMKMDSVKAYLDREARQSQFLTRIFLAGGLIMVSWVSSSLENLLFFNSMFKLGQLHRLAFLE